MRNGRLPAKRTAGAVKALVYSAPLEMALEDVPEPAFGPEDVLVRVRAVGICGSDVLGYTGKTGRRLPPLIMGHEACGTVEAVGTGVDRMGAGARVCFDSTIYCRNCPACHAGGYHLCESRQVLGVSVPGMKRQGAMAECVVMPWWTLHPMPASLSFTDAALLEPVAVALHAVRRSGLRAGETVHIIGAGTIGLLILQVCRAMAAGSIVVVDLNERRLELARDLGADAAALPQDAEALLPEKGVDVSFEVVGLASTLQAAAARASMGGRVVLVGNLTPTVPLGVQDIVARELTLIGTYASGGVFADALRMVADRLIDPRPLVSEILPLESGPAAFDRLLRGTEKGLLKVILRP